MTIRTPRLTPRSSDIDVLEMLHLRNLGHTWGAIAKRFGKRSYQGSQELCRNVCRDDLTFSGEPEDEVLAAYQ